MNVYSFKEKNMADKTDPIRDVIAEARRTQILEAAIEVFAQKGYHKATIKDVARAAGVADGTIYNYFKNKNDLMVEMVKQMAEINQLFDQIGQIARTTTLKDLLTFVLQNRLDILTQNMTRVQAILPQVITDADLRQVFFDTLLLPTMGIVSGLMQSLIERGEVRSLPPAVAVQSAFSMLAGSLVFHMLTNQSTENNEEFIRYTVDIMLNGLKPETEA